MKKKMIIPVLGLALLGFIAYGTVRAYADDISGGYPPIIQKLVERFGLDEEEVEEVFDEAREEHRVQMQARFEDRLNEAVGNGEITEDQKQLILAKHQELEAEREANRDSFQNMTHEERDQAMKTERDELKAWAEENGIDLKYLFGGEGRRGDCLGGMKGGFGPGQ